MIKNKKFVVLMTFVLILSFSIVGCGSSTTTQGNTEAASFPEVKWVMATSWAESWKNHQVMLDFAERVKTMSGGKFTIDVQPSGAIVGGMEVLDACGAGTIDCYHSCTIYWLGKHPAAPFFASIPMCFDPTMHLMWLYAGGGKEFMQQMYDELNANVYVIPAVATHAEVLAHTNKPISKVEDFKGLKYRTVGWWGEILKTVGCSVMQLPGSELYPSLERGVLDATEYCNPNINEMAGFTEVTKYVAGPGMHQPSCMYELGFNKAKYDALPDNYKEMLQTAAQAATMQGWAEATIADIAVLNQWKAKGQILTRISDEDQAKFRETAWAFVDQTIKDSGNKIAADCWASVRKFYQEYCDYEYFMEPIRPVTK